MCLTTPQQPTARAIRRSCYTLRFRPGRPRLLSVLLVSPATPDTFWSSRCVPRLIHPSLRFLRSACAAQAAGGGRVPASTPGAAAAGAASLGAGVLIGPPPKAHQLGAYPPPCLSTFFGTSPRRSRRAGGEPGGRHSGQLTIRCPSSWRSSLLQTSGTPRFARPVRRRAGLQRQPASRPLSQADLTGWAEGRSSPTLRFNAIRAASTNTTTSRNRALTYNHGHFCTWS
jgi:hypothetical protein